MEVLTSWLHQIVLIVLFAIVMDLIIPSSSFQKYIKLVMGLVIMVTLLKPIGIIFDRQFDISRIQWPDKLVFSSIDTIKSQAADLQKDQLENAAQQWNAQLEKTIKEQVESQYPLEVSRVQVQFSEPKETGKATPEIQNLKLAVHPQSEQYAKTDQVQPIQPVDIQATESQGNPLPTPHTTQETKLLSEVKKDLANKLQVSDSIISIQWDAI